VQALRTRLTGWKDALAVKIADLDELQANFDKLLA
jgi:hypothetical protein